MQEQGLPDYFTIYNLLPRYVEGKVKDRIILLYAHLADFIEMTGPVLEDIQQRMNILDATPFGQLKKSIMENSIRTDLTGARAGLSAYNRAFGRVDLYLALMMSNFQLPDFLKENNVPADQIAYFQSELREYWEATYGPHLQRLGQIHRKLDQLRQVLEKEVAMLEKLDKDYYLEALEETEQLRVLFQQERQIFWEIVEISQMTTREMSAMEAALRTHFQKVKVQIQAYRRIISSGIEKDIIEAKNILEKSVIVLIYLLGAFNMISSIPAMLKKKITRKVGIPILQRFMPEERLSQTGITLRDEALGLLHGPV